MGFAKYWRKKLLLAKAESSYGTDPTPTDAANAILASNVQLRASANQLAREFDRPYMGGRAFLLVGKQVELTFDVELATSGAAGTAPAWDAIIEACGFLGTNTPATSEVYDPVSSAFKSCTFYTWFDGQRYRVFGARGTFSIIKTIRQLPVLRFRFIGFLQNPTDTALPASPDYSAFIAPTAVEKDTWAVTYDATAIECDSLQIDINNDLQLIESSENLEVVITDRNPSGQIRCYAPDVATYDIFAEVAALGLNSLVSTLSGGAGKIITITAPATQLAYPEQAELNGNVGWTLNCSFTPTSGNDEIEIALT